MQSRLFLCCAALAFFAGCMTGSGRIDTFRSLSSTPHGYQIVEGVARAGVQSQRFEVRAGDCGQDPEWSDCDNDRERSEVTIERWMAPGSDFWVAYSIYLPPDFTTSPRVSTTIGQIHQRGGPSGTAGGLPSFPPLLQISARGNIVEACLSILTGPADNISEDCRDFTLASVSEMRGRWTDVLIHFDSSGGGELEIYINGQQKAASRDFIRFRPQDYYVKYGLYRSFVSRHGGPMPTQVAYYDEVRLGPDRGSVEISETSPVD